ncbi:hypothetical protein Tco_0315942 [Tanacetum coccineum]
MDDPNITMEEYIRLEEEKARRRVKGYGNGYWTKRQEQAQKGQNRTREGKERESQDRECAFIKGKPN